MPSSLPWKRIAAEFLAITAGISLGLLGDDFRQYRDDRTAEREYLELLARDLDRDLDRLRYARGYLELQAQAAVLLRRAASGAETSSDSVEAAGAVLAFTVTYDQQRPTFLSLREGGDLRLIRDQALRSGITDYHEISQTGILAFVTDYRLAHQRLRGMIGRHFELWPMPEFEALYPLPDELDFARAISQPSSWHSDTMFWNELGEVGARCFELLAEIDRVTTENRALRRELERSLEQM